MRMVVVDRDELRKRYNEIGGCVGQIKSEYHRVLCDRSLREARALLDIGRDLDEVIESSLGRLVMDFLSRRNCGRGGRDADEG